MVRWIRFVWLGVSAVLLQQTAFSAEPLKLTLTVSAGDRERVDALVQCPLAPNVGWPALRLVETTGGREVPVPVQLDRTAVTLHWVAQGKLAAGATRTYRLESGQTSPGSRIVIADAGKALEARLEEKPLLRYAKAHVEPGAGVNPKYGRSAHLHPVWTPSGAMVTDEFPPDHLHQSGVFFAFTKAKFEDRDVDFWNLAGGKGRVRFKELKGTASGPVFGEFRAEHEHVDLTASDNQDALGDKPGEGKVALHETWDVRVWNVGFQSGYYLLDIASRLVCAGESPLVLPEYHYGGMAIRAARPWTPEHVKFLTSAGDDRLKGNHTRPRWCDISGAIDGKSAGITLMTHPSNFRFPEPLRIHPKMPYMVYTPQFAGGFEIRPGSAHEARYRFVVHDGELLPETLERMWRDYAQPLTATPGP